MKPEKGDLVWCCFNTRLSEAVVLTYPLKMDNYGKNVLYRYAGKNRIYRVIRHNGLLSHIDEKFIFPSLEEAEEHMKALEKKVERKHQMDPVNLKFPTRFDQLDRFEIAAWAPQHTSPFMFLRRNTFWLRIKTWFSSLFSRGKSA